MEKEECMRQEWVNMVESNICDEDCRKNDEQVNGAFLH